MSVQQEALAARGMTVAEVPPEFLAELQKDKSGGHDCAISSYTMKLDTALGVLRTLANSNVMLLMQ
eukprot:3532090-Amphidinium_carterae.1